MLKQVEIFLIAIVFIFMSAIVLIVYTKEREQEHKIQNSSIQRTAAKGAAYAINLQLQSKQRHVRLFAYEYINLLRHLKQYPLDVQTEQELKTRLSQRFPDFFTYTITDQNAVPRLFDIDSFVGEACKKDLTNYVKRIKHKSEKTLVNNKIFIHPQPEHYHYDVMSPLQTSQGDTDIFFVSFYLNEIIKILKSHQIPGNTLLILKQSDSSLIEASSEGVRNKLHRDIRLSKEEQNRIEVYQNIPGTDWRVASLPDVDFEEWYKFGLWKEAGIMLLIETIAIFILLFIFFKFFRKKGASS